MEAKGFKNAVVSLSDECCDVIVGKDDVTDEKRAHNTCITETIYRVVYIVSAR